MMNAEQRRGEIAALLASAPAPLSASAVAARFGVSRQTIVGDVAILRAAGVRIAATPRGYRLEGAGAAGGSILRTVVCRHREDQILEELYAVVDSGGTLCDVTVEHPIYGQLSAQLHVASRWDADEFVKRVEEIGAAPLSRLTGGVHLHTIRCADEAVFQRVAGALRKCEILLDESL